MNAWAHPTHHAKWQLDRSTHFHTTTQQSSNWLQWDTANSPPNCPFPFNDHHQNLIHLYRARPHSPCQTASRSNQPFRHNPHVRTDRWEDMVSKISALLCYADRERRAKNVQTENHSWDWQMNKGRHTILAVVIKLAISLPQRDKIIQRLSCWLQAIWDLLGNHLLQFLFKHFTLNNSLHCPSFLVLKRCFTDWKILPHTHTYIHTCQPIILPNHCFTSKHTKSDIQLLDGTWESTYCIAHLCHTTWNDRSIITASQCVTHY